MVSTQTNQELLNRDFVLFLKRNNKSALEQRLQSKRKENLQYKRPLEWTVAKQEPLNRALTLRLAYTLYNTTKQRTYKAEALPFYIIN